MTEEQRRNLETLATYLDTLPPGYDKFDMSEFIEFDAEGTSLINELLEDDRFEEARRFLDYVVCQNNTPMCGTAACAVGHGPDAGVCMLPDEATKEKIDWLSYADRAFGCGRIGEPAFNWMFGGEWSYSDNTPDGAAARIRYYLDKGAPSEPYSLISYQEYRR